MNRDNDFWTSFKTQSWHNCSSSKWKLHCTQHCIEALLVVCLTVDDSQIRNMSQVIISLIHYFEFQVKLLGPLRRNKIEVKFFTSLWRSLLSCSIVHTGLSSRKHVLSDYLTEIEVIIRYLKTQIWVLGNR